MREQADLTDRGYRMEREWCVARTILRTAMAIADLTEGASILTARSMATIRTVHNIMSPTTLPSKRGRLRMKTATEAVRMAACSAEGTTVGASSASMAVAMAAATANKAGFSVLAISVLAIGATRLLAQMVRMVTTALCRTATMATTPMQDK